MKLLFLSNNEDSDEDYNRTTKFCIIGIQIANITLGITFDWEWRG